MEVQRLRARSVNKPNNRPAGRIRASGDKVSQDVPAKASTDREPPHLNINELSFTVNSSIYSHDLDVAPSFIFNILCSTLLSQLFLWLHGCFFHSIVLP